MSGPLRRVREAIAGVLRPASWSPEPATTITGSRGGARGSAWMAVGALLVGALATPFGSDLARPEFGRVLDGSLEVRTAGGWERLAADAAVPLEARVRAVEGSARVGVAEGVLTLAAGTELATLPGGPEVVAGSLLLEVDEPVTARTGATTAEGRGQWRIDVGVASRVAAYRGRVEVATGEMERGLEGFRQVSVRRGGLQPGLRPLRYHAGDDWDERLLAEALAVDRLAGRLAASLERTYDDRPRRGEFYAAFAAVDHGERISDLHELAATDDGERFGPPARVLLGVATIDALAIETGLSPAQAMERVVALRRAGATWGLVLVEHELGPGALRDAADRALERVEDSPPPDADPAAPDDAAPAEPAPGAEGGDAQPAETPPTSPTVPSGEPDPDDGGGGSSGPVEDGLDDPAGPVEEALDDPGGSIADLLDDPVGGAGGAVEDAADGLPEL